MTDYEEIEKDVSARLFWGEVLGAVTFIGIVNMLELMMKHPLLSISCSVP